MPGLGARPGEPGADGVGMKFQVSGDLSDVEVFVLVKVMDLVIGVVVDHEG